MVGNTAANVTAGAVTKIDTTHFSLDGTTGNGAYVSGGYIKSDGAPSYEWYDNGSKGDFAFLDWLYVKPRIAEATQSGPSVNLVLIDSVDCLVVGDFAIFTNVAGLSSGPYTVSAVTDSTHISVTGTLTEAYGGGGWLIGLCYTCTGACSERNTCCPSVMAVTLQTYDWCNAVTKTIPIPFGFVDDPTYEWHGLAVGSWLDPWGPVYHNDCETGDPSTTPRDLVEARCGPPAGAPTHAPSLLADASGWLFQGVPAPGHCFGYDFL